MTTPHEEMTETGLSRRDALKQGIGTISAAGLAVSAPKIQGLATTPKYGAALSGIKKRRCHVRRLRFSSVPRRVKYSRTSYSRYSYSSYSYNGDPRGICSYKGSVTSTKTDFRRTDLSKVQGYGDCYGGRRTSERLGQVGYECIVTENVNGECGFLVNLSSQFIGNCSIKNISYSNRSCRVDSSSYQEKSDSRGRCAVGGFFKCSPYYTQTCEVAVEVEMEEEPEAPAPIGGDTLGGK